MRLCALTLTSFSVASTSIRSFSKIESCVFMIKLFWATLPLCWEFVKQALDLKVRPSALGSYSKEKGIQFGAEHLIRFSTKLSLSLNHGAKVRIFPFLPNFCDESSGNLCSVSLWKRVSSKALEVISAQVQNPVWCAVWHLRRVWCDSGLSGRQNLPIWCENRYRLRESEPKVA